MPTPPTTTGDQRRPRLLLVAYACDPDESMESRLGFRRAVNGARRHDVTVVYALGPDPETLAQRAADAGADGVHFRKIDHAGWDQWCCGTACFYYIGYRGWHRRVLAEARAEHAIRPFDLVHQVNFCGFREPGEAWRLDAPFVWGPVGGTEGFPLRFLTQADPVGGAREVFRTLVNACQLRFSPRVHQAAQRAARVLTANSAAQRMLKKHVQIETICDLETGVDIPDYAPRQLRPHDEPLRVLWAGRLKTWKGLPLLIRAIAKLPEGGRPIVRVLGRGDREQSWRRLAERLGVADRLEWVGWASYAEQLPHYRWADVFAFTSLRDTSGTGLLEALAAGAPIVGLDHSGARDIMSDASAIAIPVTSPSEVISAFASAFDQLRNDKALLLRLCRGARCRAEEFSWEARAAVMDAVYNQCLADQLAVVSTAPRAPAILEDQASFTPALTPSVLTTSGVRL